MATSRSSISRWAGHDTPGLKRRPPIFTRTHCAKRNHAYAEWGRYGNGVCRECKRLDNAAKAATEGHHRERKRKRKAGQCKPIRIDREPMAWRKAELRQELARLQAQKAPAG
jgi:hypothetical protein